MPVAGRFRWNAARKFFGPRLVRQDATTRALPGGMGRWPLSEAARLGHSMAQSDGSTTASASLPTSNIFFVSFFLANALGFFAVCPAHTATRPPGTTNNPRSLHA